jgi:serine/threonine-protein kinase RsbT
MTQSSTFFIIRLQKIYTTFTAHPVLSCYASGKERNFLMSFKQRRTIAVALSNSESPLRSPAENKIKQMLLSGAIYHIDLFKALDPSIARATVRKLAAAVGYSMVDQVRLATATFQIAWDFVTFAGRSQVSISWYENEARRKGLRMSFCDYGTTDPRLRMILKSGADKTATDKLNYFGLTQLVDEFEIGQDAQYGNCVTVTKWLE